MLEGVVPEKIWENGEILFLRMIFLFFFGDTFLVFYPLISLVRHAVPKESIGADSPKITKIIFYLTFKDFLNLKAMPLLIGKAKWFTQSEAVLL